VRFNPKVESFKTTVSENKTNTLGSQFPFISRSGKTAYKEFNLSGLISYLMDNEETFMTKAELGLINQSFDRVTTEAVDEGAYDTPSTIFSAERIFKLAVMDWLTDGNPKLFRSAAEGNYLVRLMNVNLTPENTLGRMVHNFSSQAYEIAEYSYENLRSYNFVGAIENRVNALHYYKLDLTERLNGSVPRFEFAPSAKARIVEATPYTSYRLGFSTGEFIDITVGTTGYYEVNTRLGLLSSIQPLSAISQGSLEYTMQGYSNYYLTTEVNGETRIITEITGREYGGQFYGANSNIVENMLAAANGTYKVLNNILYLSLKAKDLTDLYNLNTTLPAGTTNVDYSCVIEYADGSIDSLDLSPNKVDENTVITGRIDYTALDFDNNFAPVSI
jgi:hypothetical protein